MPHLGDLRGRWVRKRVGQDKVAEGHPHQRIDETERALGGDSIEKGGALGEGD